MKNEIMLLKTNTIQANPIRIICETISKVGLNMENIRIGIKTFTCRNISEYEFVEPYVDLSYEFYEIGNTVRSYGKMKVHVSNDQEDEEDSKSFYEVQMNIRFIYDITNIQDSKEFERRKRDVLSSYAKDFMYTYMASYIETSGIDWMIGKHKFPKNLTLDGKECVYRLDYSEGQINS